MFCLENFICDLWALSKIMRLNRFRFLMKRKKKAAQNPIINHFLFKFQRNQRTTNNSKIYNVSSSHTIHDIHEEHCNCARFDKLFYSAKNISRKSSFCHEMIHHCNYPTNHSNKPQKPKLK